MSGFEASLGKESAPSFEAVEAERLVAESAKGGHVRVRHEGSVTTTRRYLQDPRVLSLVGSLEAHDAPSVAHSIRTTEVALDVARDKGIYSEKLLRILALAGLLHDIGKMRTPLEVLNKPGGHTSEEKEVMERHVRDAIEILGSSEASGLPEIEEIEAVIGRHHEYKLEGPYPRSAQAEHAVERRREIRPEIETLARILAAADNVDGLTGDRPYRPNQAPLPKEKAEAILKRQLKEEVVPDLELALERYKA